MPGFVVIMGQGRSGSTLLLRMLNAVPGVRISGENAKAFDHLRTFVESFRAATAHHHTEFYRLAWQLPCTLDELTAKTARYVNDIFNPGNRYRLTGFKEIRYGWVYEDLVRDVAFLRELFPDLRIIFNTRATKDAVNSEFWKENPEESRRILEASRANFQRFHATHPDITYNVPFEEFHEGSSVLQGMFDFLEIEYSAGAHAELKKKLR